MREWHLHNDWRPKPSTCKQPVLGPALTRSGPNMNWKPNATRLLTRKLHTRSQSNGSSKSFNCLLTKASTSYRSPASQRSRLSHETLKWLYGTVRKRLPPNPKFREQNFRKKLRLPNVCL